MFIRSCSLVNTKHICSYKGDPSPLMTVIVTVKITLAVSLYQLSRLVLSVGKPLEVE